MTTQDNLISLLKERQNKLFMDIETNANKLKKWCEQEGISTSDSESEDEDEWNEICIECEKKMSDTKLTEEEYDEHPDRDGGYISHSLGDCDWYCVDCRNNFN